MNVGFRFEEAWNYASSLDSREAWLDLAKASMHHMDIDFGNFIREKHATFISSKVSA